MTSSSGTVVSLGDGGTIVDSMGNQWSISASGQVIENGVTDTFTSNVTELAFKNGVLWQENTSFLWYAKVGNVPGAYHGWAAGTYVAPVPVTRTWVGGGNNSAGNPNDWNDHGVPQIGDAITMTHGTMNITGGQLRGDFISVPLGSPLVTLNVSGISPFTMNVGGFGPDSNAIVNLAANSAWVGGFSDGPIGDNVTVNGPGVFENTSSRVYGTAVIGANVVGTGTFVASYGHGPGRIEFAHSVAANQTIDINASGYGSNGGTVQVDDPANYHAVTDLSFGHLILGGLKASSYTYGSSTMNLFNGNMLVASLTVENGQNGAYTSGSITASQVGANIDIHKSTLAGVSLPIHV
jgi:hypothetical protein